MRKPGPRAIGAASWEALGSVVVVRCTVPSALTAVRAAVEAEISSVDLACSRFRADSELVRVNARAGRSTTVTPLLLEALELALRAAELTDGDVDPTVGRALELNGYDRDWRLLEAPPSAPGAVTVTAHLVQGWRSVILDRGRSSVAIPPGAALDLGATAKAWAADRAAAAAALVAGCGVLVGIGGDIATAGPPPPRPWLVRVTDDHRDTDPGHGQLIAIESGGLATSSTSARRWRQGAHAMHHIIDPRTGAPAESVWRTVSAAAATCAEANIATTAALMRGEDAPGWLEELRLPARMVARDGAVTTVAGWPVEELLPAARGNARRGRGEFLRSARAIIATEPLRLAGRPAGTPR